jgi:hypothetical protein
MKSELDSVIFVEFLLLSCFFFQETGLILFSIQDGCIKFFTDIITWLFIGYFPVKLILLIFLT